MGDVSPAAPASPVMKAELSDDDSSCRLRDASCTAHCFFSRPSSDSALPSSSRSSSTRRSCDASAVRNAAESAGDTSAAAAMDPRWYGGGEDTGDADTGDAVKGDWWMLRGVAVAGGSIGNDSERRLRWPDAADADRECVRSGARCWVSDCERNGKPAGCSCSVRGVEASDSGLAVAAGGEGAWVGVSLAVAAAVGSCMVMRSSIGSERRRRRRRGEDKKKGGRGGRKGAPLGGRGGTGLDREAAALFPDAGCPVFEID